MTIYQHGYSTYVYLADLCIANRNLKLGGTHRDAIHRCGYKTGYDCLREIAGRVEKPHRKKKRYDDDYYNDCPAISHHIL
jgi:hypothetical protein